MTAYKILQKEPTDNEYEKRIFYLTDAIPQQGEIEPLLKLNEEASKKGIYTTFFGVGVDFNAPIIEQICKAKGSSYYTIYNELDFNKLLAEDFNYMVFPFAFDIMIKTDARVKNIYGSNDTDTNHQGRLTYIQSFMPSNIIEKGVKGGIILLKLKDFAKEINLSIIYSDRNG